MKKEAYNDYRLRVLARTKGSHLHTINGLLGNVQGSIELPDVKDIYDDAVRNIAKLTGVLP